jgi:hypothetical protein
MKTQKASSFWLILPILFVAASTNAQSLLGTWQMTKEENCIEANLPSESDNTLADEMKSMSGPSAQIIRFKEKGAAEQSTRILTKRKYANSKNLMYKRSGETLHILDKKSQTLAESFTIDRLTADSLILSNPARPCEIKFFVKIKKEK